MANKEKESQAVKRWRDRNRDKLRAQGRERYRKDPSKRIRDREWKRRNRAKMTEAQRRRELAKIQRTPKWADLEAIKATYAVAEIYTRETGMKHHVDHLVPLNGENVCGLHVENNLRIIPAHWNLKKKNRWDSSRDWPEDYWLDKHWQHLTR